MSGLNLDLYNSSLGLQTQGTTSHSTPGANTKIAKMKKLNIFSAANRKTYHSDRKNSSPIVSPSGDTIHRIVTKKEEVNFYYMLEIGSGN